MYRRRRVPERAALFSFDSFLDVVANVIGIVIRLILVAWVGSRLYKGPALPPPPPPAEVLVEKFTPPPEDPRPALELARQQAELERSRQAALDALNAWQAIHRQREQVEQQVTLTRQQREELERQQPNFSATLAQQKEAGQKAALSLAQLRERNEKLQAELKELRKTPRATNQLTYRLPISAAVQTEEVFFECRNGRVTVIDVASLLDEIRQTIREKGERLKTTWTVEDTTAPQGAFRLRYTVERERGFLPNGNPNPNDSFNYGLSRWVVEPVQEIRGETVKEALQPGSAFRKIVEGFDAKQAVVTLWVYPDSFEVYRELRDFLHEREMVVAGRPLPEGVSIASSRKGTTSRGQ